jgi:hypothetical protein
MGLAAQPPTGARDRVGEGKGAHLVGAEEGRGTSRRRRRWKGGDRAAQGREGGVASMSEENRKEKNEVVCFVTSGR